MIRNTHLSTAIDATNDKDSSLDKHIKELLADVQILSRIVKYTVKEVEHLTVDEIIRCIDYDAIEIGKRPIDSGLSNLGKIENLQTENAILGEGYITFDIRFVLYYNEFELKIIINIEAQKSI